MFHQDLRLQDPNGHAFNVNPFNHNHSHQPLQQVHHNTSPHTPHQHNGSGGQFGILTTGPVPQPSTRRADRFVKESSYTAADGGPNWPTKGHMETKIVVDPPDLQEWRDKLFHVDEAITLSQDEFQTYFPHIDNVYSHRSTQNYKKKPFRSHYYDCRLKGRPPGTKKSDDPNKKKRKRIARERDLCDVKIKVTEYFEGAWQLMQSDGYTGGYDDDDGPPGQSGSNFFGGNNSSQMQQGQFGTGFVQTGIPANHPGASGQRWYTIQRVNGNGGNGKGDGVAGPHKHDLAYSDQIKKNTVARFLLAQEKEQKKTQKTYHKKASGNALATVKKHSKEVEFKFFANCFNPSAQRVWIALEVKGIQYQYIEVDPYKKPQSLVDADYRGLIPTITHGDFRCSDSTILLEYLEDLHVGQATYNLLPHLSPQLKAKCRIWSKHIDDKIVPLFYSILKAQEQGKVNQHTHELQEAINLIVKAADPAGPFFLNAHLGFVDVHFAPIMIRLSKVLKPYRDWSDPIQGSRWAHWIEAVMDNEHVKNTTSTDDLYVDSYEGLAQNRLGAGEWVG
ncbi:hypothetical protein B0O99DRAFT_631793 [Bisporella sp. PMI_857]|nr:hypothetical protein B0O99DRAFT_631793 [Bisporella sp. PMI_857]